MTPKKYPQNFHTQKNIYFSENPKKYRNSKFWTQKNGPSLRMYENIRVPPPLGSHVTALYTYSKWQTVWIPIRPDFLSGFEPPCVTALCLWYGGCFVPFCYLVFFLFRLSACGYGTVKKTKQKKYIKNATRKKRKDEITLGEKTK